MAETPQEKAERERKENAERARREQEQRNKQAQTANQTPTTPKGGKTTKALAYTPGQRQETQIGDPRGDTFLTKEEIEGLAGDLGPGEVGYVKLDEEGTPTGEAVRKLPPAKDDQTWARVVGSPKVAYDDIVTPSGAPVTKFMNPEPSIWDAGMLARNPPPEDTGEDEAAGPGVINKPGPV